MHLLENRALAVVLGAAVVVGGANLAAYAASGHPLLLGHTNKASHTTTLVNHGPGPALSITTRDDTPPFEVSSQAKVRRLDADRVDGDNASDLQTRTTTFTLPRGADTPFSFLLKGVKPGTYLATYDVVLQSSGDAVPHCTLEMSSPHADILSGLAYGPAVQLSAVSGSSLVTVAKNGHLFIGCANGVQVAANPPNNPSTVTVLKVDQNTSGQVAVD